MRMNDEDRERDVSTSFDEQTMEFSRSKCFLFHILADQNFCLCSFLSAARYNSNKQSIGNETATDD